MKVTRKIKDACASGIGRGAEIERSGRLSYRADTSEVRSLWKALAASNFVTWFDTSLEAQCQAIRLRLIESVASDIDYMKLTSCARSDWSAAISILIRTEAFQLPKHQLNLTEKCISQPSTQNVRGQTVLSNIHMLFLEQKWQIKQNVPRARIIHSQRKTCPKMRENRSSKQCLCTQNCCLDDKTTEPGFQGNVYVLDGEWELREI